MKKITIILGPTGIGKTEFAINKALAEEKEIISADAFQVYKEFNIGTAKASSEDLQLVPHHLIDIIEATESYNVVKFITHTKKIISDSEKAFIICGGTAYYLSAFLYQYDFKDAPESDPKLRTKIENEIKMHGHTHLLDELKTIDPKYFDSIDKQNPRRLIRAIEIIRQTKKAPSEFKIKGTRRKDCDIIGLNSTRDQIYAKINNRVDKMIKNGLIDEVDYLLKKYPESSPAFQGIGYKQCIEYLNGTIEKTDMINTIKKLTRHFAKRQETWFKKFENVNWLS